jgi:hypothetical protein
MLQSVEKDALFKRYRNKLLGNQCCTNLMYRSTSGEEDRQVVGVVEAGGVIEPVEDDDAGDREDRARSTCHQGLSSWAV